jgi:squalene monooxygenase
VEAAKKFDVCIIGAGVAGGAMAAYLGKHGLKVAVIEKSLTEQERIVGELLQPGGVLQLNEMGLGHLLEGFDAQRIEGYGLFLNGNQFNVGYPTDNSNALTGRGFRNAKFVGKIREYLFTLPNLTVIEGKAEELITLNGKVTGIKYLTKDDETANEIEAPLTVVSDGMFSTFREQLAENKKQVSGYFLGMILKDCNLPFPNFGHVILAQPSACLVYPISSTETRILIDFPGKEAPKKSPELIDFLKQKIGPQLPSQMRHSFINALEEGKFKVMPNHLAPAKPFFKPGVVLLGDSLNMRHPLTGGGMTAALTDIKNLGNKLLALNNFDDSCAVDKAVFSFYKSRHKQNASINILADALYGVTQNEDLKTACFNYLNRGGVYSEEPVSILSAVSRSVPLLLKHFFAVAIYGVRKILWPYPNLNKIKRSYKLLQAATAIVAPLVLNERPGAITRFVFKTAHALFAPRAKQPNVIEATDLKTSSTSPNRLQPWQTIQNLPA